MATAPGFAVAPRSDAPSVARTWDRPLCVVVGSALAIRLAIICLFVAVAPQHQPRFHEPDSVGYRALAQSLVDGNAFSIDGVTEITRTPGYPLLLTPGVLMALPTLWAIACQLLLAAWTTVVTYWIAQELTSDRRVSLLAAGLFAFEPLSVLYTAKVLTEPTFAALVATLVWFLIHFIRASDWKSIVWGGALTAAAMFVRPIAYFLPLVAACYLTVALFRQAAQPKRLACQILVYLLIATAPAALWQYRNYRLTGYGVFAAIIDINLYDAAEAMHDRSRFPPSQRMTQQAFVEELRTRYGHGDASTTKAELFRRAGSDSFWKLLQDPLGHFALRMRGLKETFLDNGTSAYLGMIEWTAPPSVASHDSPTRWLRLQRALRDKPLLVATYSLLEAALWSYGAAAVLGSFALRRAPRAELGMLLVVAGYLLLASAGPANGHRFRLPIIPLECVLAAAGIAVLIGRIRLRQRTSLASMATCT